MNLFGTTRTHITRNYALVAPDGYVETGLPGWTGVSAVTLISPQMGAAFVQTLITVDSAGESAPPLPGVERFIYVVAGELVLTLDKSDKEVTLRAGGFAYLPPNQAHTLTSTSGARLNLFERRYIELKGTPLPEVITGHQVDVLGEPFLGDEHLIVKKFLPEHPSFDLAVNVMTFQPGAALPFVETHIMEHGLLMLSGGGIYKVEENWYPVREGDAIWMGPYCSQWFGALGREPASYLLYKEVNRDPFSLEKES